jgi:hypothetical protein
MGTLVAGRNRARVFEAFWGARAPGTKTRRPGSFDLVAEPDKSALGRVHCIEAEE